MTADRTRHPAGLVGSAPDLDAGSNARVPAPLTMGWRATGLATGLAIVLAMAPSAAVEAAPSAAVHSRSMVDLVAKVIPTVVNITAHRVAAPRNANGSQAAFTRVRESVGSGFVASPTGCIVTNRHVVDGAYEINVTFSDGRSRKAKLVWMSSVVDVAFLKVLVDTPIPFVTLSADETVRIGERVIAVGNPLGLGMSVSAGIVSALDRNIKESPYDAFIQTDAAINHGSSGGPLFNEAGEVIGINTALYTSVSNGGSEGLGFAIPGRDVVFLIDQFKRYGRVRAGWLGVNAQKLTPDMAEALRFPGTFGAIVAAVVPKSPAETIGLRSGDIIQTVDDVPIEDVTTLNRAVALALGKTVALEVWRDGASRIIPTTVVEGGTSAEPDFHDTRDVAPRFASIADMGLSLAPIDDKARERFGPRDDPRGLIVTDVAGDSVADAAGLRPGDMFVSAQMAPVSTIPALDQLILDQARAGRRRMMVLVRSAGGERWVALPLRL